MDLNSIPSFKILSRDSLKYKTFITQEMLKHKILATNTIYISIVHRIEFLQKYEKVLDIIFSKMKNVKKNNFQ